MGTYQVHIVRDDRVRPGGEGVLEMPGEILFVVSAAGVTEEGAGALEDCWGWFIKRGIWRFGQDGGESITTAYHLGDLGDYAARVTTKGGMVDCYCSHDHFTRGSVNGLEAVARASVRRGWRYYAPSRTIAVA